MQFLPVIIFLLILNSSLHAKITLIDDNISDEKPALQNLKDVSSDINSEKENKIVYGKPYTVFGVTYYPMDYIHKYEEEGIASWYGADFHGKTTSSKEVYNMYDMTAAHKTLPLGSTVLVKSLENDREVVVRINDRGPFVKDRIIDLSYKAAKELGIDQKGTARVRVTLLSESPNQFVLNGKPVDINRGNFSIQIGAFQDKRNATALKDKFLNADIVEAMINGKKFYRVRLIGFETRIGAELKLITLEKQFPGAFIVAD
ncbi:septal ring lytic transglycosylase RlpA family protein [Calditerrivibrio nitroreducens]|uniref:Probable endolytic peptidoglycan transglycosylase RlpA n=1 Tax=Calditerrivibrio nitroreducens (strain DSM 19672 / NBRC 101217 / Yu37-1) TaxID=768670 RepID=E4TIH1_CALNY|nr:septal ring lytic transglycosylase RlpA family protein [Calditerrivibrio nitroreducens]ADR17996.1 rare lipoprotein A [Calditerrivibrio nitroreducens DSM 19672]